MATEEQDQVSK